MKCDVHRVQGTLYSVVPFNFCAGLMQKVAS